MRTRGALILVSLMLSAGALAGAPELIAHFSAQAGADFEPSAARGRAFYRDTGGADNKMPNCASCHGTDPAAAGKHAFTGKRIEPLAPATNAARFTDLEKVEKWFRRNCKDVLERECTAREKADYIQFLSEVTR